MRKLLLFLTLGLLPLSIHAEAGDATAVLQFCGTPTSEHQGVSQVTNRLERDLTYDRLILHFQPSQGGWSFLSGWYAHVPVTEKMVESRMPCFRQAMAASAEWARIQTPHEDPAISLQTAAPAADTSTFGIPHLGLIIVLAVMTIILALLPSRRRRPMRVQEVERMRHRRKPGMESSTSTKSHTRLDV